MDAVDRRVGREVRAGVARAYGYRPTDDFRDACPRCHGDGTVPVAGYSVNPGSGVHVRDPQEKRDERCPVCGGTGTKA